MSHTPKYAIREWLAEFRATWHPPGTEPSRMLPNTVRFLRWRELPSGQMCTWRATASESPQDRIQPQLTGRIQLQ